MEYEKFYGQIIKAGGSLAITIPYRLAKFSNINEGDSVKVMIKKHDVKEDFKSGEEILKDG